MTAQINAELLKIRSTRTTIGLALAMIAIILLFALLSGLLTKAAHLTTSQDQLGGLLSFGSIAGVFSALAGIMLITSEYRYGTIRPTFIFSPRRSRVLGAKLAAGLLAGLAFGIAGEALGFGIGYVILDARGIPYAPGTGQTALVLCGPVAASALWGAIGVGVGAIVRSQVGAIITILAWGFVVENLLQAFVPSVGRFAPGNAENGLFGLTGKHLLTPAAGAATLIAWTAALAAIGAALAARRDVG
jgi:ABC-2 type transport system permease protein